MKLDAGQAVGWSVVLIIINPVLCNRQFYVKEQQQCLFIVNKVSKDLRCLSLSVTPPELDFHMTPIFRPLKRAFYCNTHSIKSRISVSFYVYELPTPTVLSKQKRFPPPSSPVAAQTPEHFYRSVNLFRLLLTLYLISFVTHFLNSL